MSDDIVVEDPIGEAVTNPDGTGVRGKEALAAFYDANIGPNHLTRHLRGDVPVELADRDRLHPGVAHRVPERLHRDRARRVHLPGQRRRADHQPARLLEHGRDDVRRRARRPISRTARRPRRGRRRRHPRYRARGRRTARRPGCAASSSTDATRMRLPKRHNAFPALSRHPGSPADPAVADALIDTCVGEFGSIDILVNCAGTAEPGAARRS